MLPESYPFPGNPSRRYSVILESGAFSRHPRAGAGLTHATFDALIAPLRAWARRRGRCFMRPSRTSLLALTGLLAASVAWAQDAPRSGEPRRSRRPRRRSRRVTRPRRRYVETRRLSRGSRGHRPEAHGGHRGDPGVGHGVARPVARAAADRRLQGPRAAGAGLEPDRRPGRVSPASPCAASIPAAWRRPSASTSTTCRSGRARGLANGVDPVRRLRHVRHRPGGSAARATGHLVRSELARRRHEVRSEPAQYRRGSRRGCWAAPRPSTTATPDTP